jgi:hypothetical protein
VIAGNLTAPLDYMAASHGSGIANNALQKARIIPNMQKNFLKKPSAPTRAVARA